MTRIEPKVIKLAETKLDQDGVEKLAEHYAATEWLDRAKKLQTNESELLIKLAGEPVTRVSGSA